MVGEATPGSGALGAGAGAEGTAGAQAGDEEVQKLKADNTRLRQDLARLKSAAQAAVPLVQVAEKLRSAPGGKEILEKLDKGEPLTAGEAKKAEAAVAAAGEGTLTKDEIKQIIKEELKGAVREFSETVSTERKAAQSMEKLDERATKELEGYSKMKDDPQFKYWTSAVLQQLEDGVLELPPGEKDVWWFTLKTAYRAMNAAQGKPVKMGRTEAERVAEVVAAGGTRPASGRSAEDSDIPAELREKIEAIRRIGTRTISGRSFANPKRREA